MTMKRLRMATMLGLTLGCAALVMHPHHAFAASPDNPPCVGGGAYGVPRCFGYFTGADGTAVSGNLNLLQNVLTPGSNALNGVSSASDFIKRVNNDLVFGGPQDNMGAAFIIDTMLNHSNFSGAGGVSGGINFAKAAVNNDAWQALVNYYANSPNPGTYGVIWTRNLTNLEYCGSPGAPTINSAYFTNINDDAFHSTVCYGGVPPIGFDGNPVIEFYWPGGSFIIGKPCGNVELSIDKIPPPPVDNPPVGSITVACVADQQVATITFSDPDAPTTAFITINGWTSATYNSTSPQPQKITIPPPPTTDPWNAQPVTVHVKDSGPGGSGELTWTALTQVPCASFACGSLTVDPSIADPYMKFAVTVSVTNNVGTQPPGATMKLKISPPPGASYTYNNTQPAGWNGASFYTFTPVGPTNNTGVFTATWTLTVGTVNTTCSDTFPVVYLPYLHAYGGDVSVGASPIYDASGVTACTSQDPSSGVFSWNNHGTDFSGAGTQYAVQALQQVLDFASAVGSDSSPPTALTFANYFSNGNPGSVDVPNGIFGGYFGDAAHDCDFTSDITTPPVDGATVDPPSSVSGQVILYANSDVYITHNVVYSGAGGWASPGQIPYLRLVVVGGNIYIAPNVTQLDGLYVAQRSTTQPDGDGSAGGGIFTCASARGVKVDLSSPGAYSTCNKQLLINGAFVAEHAEFSRTYGSLGQAKAGDSLSSNHAAEVFNYTPELWLPRGGTPADNGYDAITGLPPVL